MARIVPGFVSPGHSPILRAAAIRVFPASVSLFRMMNCANSNWSFCRSASRRSFAPTSTSPFEPAGHSGKITQEICGVEAH
ncbi:hypothetical protein [Paracoccus salsus]|uniref:hypothetical protein n=1 Tax=Paracoccus salsus TaxID=2911061 RepID=UPI001F3F01C0|nr:hypothetical protein [Paracoccus salsus]MCF3974804.1 hypothetical protein [Paracoccus salsus]